MLVVLRVATLLPSPTLRAVPEMMPGRDFLLTQRLILPPQIEVNVDSKTDPARLVEYLEMAPPAGRRFRSAPPRTQPVLAVSGMGCGFCGSSRTRMAFNAWVWGDSVCGSKSTSRRSAVIRIARSLSVRSSRCIMSNMARKRRDVESGTEPSRACGTDGSNPLPSSRQSVSLRLSRPFEEKPGFSATMRTIARGSCRQRRENPSNIARSGGSVSVGLYSSTAVLPDAVRDIGDIGRNGSRLPREGSDHGRV
jgi:hypothetical protein